MPAEVARVVALGASNLTRGFQTVVSTARATWGPNVEIVAALGHGRSYGAHSRFVIRTLPGILQSGLWRHLESLSAAPTRARSTPSTFDRRIGGRRGRRSSEASQRQGETAADSKG